jgi:hypothetical protein
MDIPSLIEPWYEVLRDHVPDGFELFDAHTHIGQNDPDGMKATPDDIVAGLRLAGAIGSFVFPMHEPDGYPPANDMVLEAAERSDGMLIPFCRVNPHDDALAEARRCLAAGARGIKLHPRAEEFTLDHPGVRPLVALAAERQLPILIHAGRGIPALGADAIALADEFPGARLILAHAAICDLAWIWHAAPDHPNLLFDTAWWMPADLAALFALVPPGQIVFASDAPYASTLLGSALIRGAVQAGLSADQIRCVTSGQALRLAAGEPLEAAGAAPGARERPPHLLLDRVAEFLLLGVIASYRGGDGSEMIALARLACDVPADVDDAPVFAAILRLLDAYEEAAAPDDRSAMTLLILALVAARTPDVPVPGRA